MSDRDDTTPPAPSEEPVTLEEPGTAETTAETTDDTAPSPDPDTERNAIWMRLLHMIIFALLFALAETVLAACAVLQFFWMLFKGKPNAPIAQFGGSLGGWLADVARFQTAQTEDKPFPWTAWR